MPEQKRLFRPPLLVSAVCLLMLTSCSMKSLYFQLDWLIPQFIEEYIPLDDKQEQTLKLRLQKILLWHRHTQLPEYVNWLGAFQKDTAQGLSEKQVLQHYKQLELLWKTLLTRLADDVAALLFSTSQEQRVHLFKTFARKNDDFKKKYIEAETDVIRNNMVIQISDEYTRWLGQLEPTQQMLIQEAGKKLKPTAALHLNNRLILQNKLKNILNDTTSVNQLKFELKNLVSHWEDFRSHEYEKVLEYNQTILFKLTSDISLQLNTKQKNYLTQKIDYYIKLFNELGKKIN